MSLSQVINAETQITYTWMFLIEMILLAGCKQDLGDNQISWVEWIHKLPFKMFDTISVFYWLLSTEKTEISKF